MLHEFLASKRSDIIARTKVKVAARPAPRVTETELTDGVPFVVDQLIETLKGAALPDTINVAATKRGGDLLCAGLTIGQVIHDYGHLCQAVTELAFELDAKLTFYEFRTLNRCLDNAIAEAVTAYGRIRKQSIADQGMKRLGAVRVSGSTGTPQQRTLKGLNDLIERTLAGVRLDSAARKRETILLAEFVEGVESSVRQKSDGSRSRAHGRAGRRFSSGAPGSDADSPAAAKLSKPTAGIFTSVICAAGGVSSPSPCREKRARHLASPATHRSFHGAKHDIKSCRTMSSCPDERLWRSGIEIEPASFS